MHSSAKVLGITFKMLLFLHCGRFLATGDQLRTIATSFSMGRSTVWNIINDSLIAIWKALGPRYLKVTAYVNFREFVRPFFIVIFI